MFGKSLSLLALSICTFTPFVEASENLMQDEIEHVVLILLENRSFDNVLAWLYKNDAPNFFIPQNTNPQFLGLSEDTLDQYTNHLVDASGQIVYSCAPIQGVPSVATGPFLNSPSTDPNEPFPNVTNQIFNGGTQPTMSGFLQDYATLWDPETWVDQKIDICSVMETYTEKELPVLNGLAKHYAVSDLWFSSVPTQTNPNRAFAACGTSEGQTVNGPAGISTFHADTIWNRLTEESPETTWMIFWQSDMIPEIVKGPYTSPKIFANLGRIPNLSSHYQKIDAFHNLARQGKLAHFSYIEPQWTLSENVAPKNFLEKFFKPDGDELAGLQGNDLHPPGDVRTAENLLANIYTSLIANPETWKKTLLIVTFDEHGGLFDHIAPPPAIAPDAHFEDGFKFDRYGVRVPAIFISPKINKGTVIRGDQPSAPFDHTSLIATILKWKNIDKAKWNMGKRVEIAPTFEGVITRSDDRKDLVLKPDSVVLSDKGNVVQMGDRFYLRDKNGNYLTQAGFLFKIDARIGESKNRVELSFVEGQGPVTHGSFIVLQSHDPALGSNNVLGTSLLHSDCIYAANRHNSTQWWTIKSYDSPYVGAEIHYGDRIYIENHIYLSPTDYIPARLVQDSSIFGKFLKTSAIIEQGSEDNYWYFERVEDSSMDVVPNLVRS